jgi:cytochrome c biogenesis protein CcdA/glutaredoxin
MKKSASLLFIFLILISTSQAQPINLEYFYQPGCYDCKETDSIIEQIEKQYEEIEIIKSNVRNTEGFNRWNQYDFLEVPAIVINNETRISKEEITEENLKRTIDKYLEGGKVEEQSINRKLNIPFAYSLGLFAGMSPCLMAILGFLLSFTAGTSESVRNGMAKATVFGVGLVTSYLAIGIGLIIFKRTIPNIEIFSLITGVVVIVIGLHLMGFFKLPITMENYFHNTARKHAGTIGGLFFLGVLFSLVKVPCTLPMLLVLLDKTVSQGTLGDLSLLLVFSLGVLTPFIGVGLIGGYTLSKRIREYRGYIKLISGTVLVLLGLWILIL